MSAILRVWGMALLIFFQMAGFAQTQLEIHQINVGNGDGALIKLYDKDKLIYTIVIDGGLKSGDDNKFLPYLRKFIPEMPDHAGIRKVDWVILSHNHQDHFNGLIEMFNDDGFVVRKITDQFGYNIGDNNFTLPLPDARDDNCEPFITRGTGVNPQPSLVEYVQAVQTANVRTKAILTDPIRADTMFDCAENDFYDTDLPEVGGVRPRLSCIAANGVTRGTVGRKVGGKNANNFTYGWVLSFGEFRFYTGGDLGGYATGAYTDQETPMAAYLKTRFPNSHPETGPNTGTNFPGHICVMKTNHHGSTASSNDEFLKTLACSSIITSAGKHGRWKIPTTEFVDRVAAIPAFGAVRGVYFTQIYNYPGDNARTEANDKFDGKAAYNYVLPGDTEATQYSYVFYVQPKTVYLDPPKPKRTIDITKESIYNVDKVRTSDFERTAQYLYLCHKP